MDQGAKLLLFCSPHNPVGRVWTPDALRQLSELFIACDIRIIADEIHCDLVFANSRHLPLASLSPALAARTITCISAVKTFKA